MTQLVCIGLNHKSAPLALREQVALSERDQQQTLITLTALPGIDEAVVLSTCNRTEFYLVGQTDLPVESVYAVLASPANVSALDIVAHSYCLSGIDVIRHVMRVAAGLDSQVIGEPQILGQLARSYEQSVTLERSGPILSALIQRALHAGKRARTETPLSSGAASISAVAAHHTTRVFGELTTVSVLIVGVGEMGEATARAFWRRGVSRLTLATRTFEHAQALADQVGGHAVPFTALADAFHDTDVIVTATTAPHTLIHPADLSAALTARGLRPLLILDLALPRNVAPEVGALPSVQLLNLDQLQEDADHSLLARESFIPQVEAILAEEAAEFQRWYGSRAVTPVIRQLRSQADVIREAELAQLVTRLPNLSERDRELLEQFSQRLVNKLLHQPTLRLKEQTEVGQTDLYAHIVSDLFGLTG